MQGGGYLSNEAMAQDALSEQGAPQGEGMPSDMGESEVSPEEQEQYDMVVTNALEMIHGEQSRDDVLEALKGSQKPHESVGRMTAQIGLQMYQSAAKSEVELSPDVLFHAGYEISVELLLLGNEAGLWQLGDDQMAKEAEQAMYLAVQVYGEKELESGVDTSEFKDHMNAKIAEEKAQGATAGMPPAQPPTVGV